eukprot:2852438-Alexandrium_andersonii.AAC.1
MERRHGQLRAPFCSQVEDARTRPVQKGRACRPNEPQQFKASALEEGSRRLRRCNAKPLRR